MAADRTTVTYHMNRLQSLRSRSELCVTLNRSDQIDPASVIATIPYAHPVFTAAGHAAQQRHHEISGRNRTHYCGAYWGWGFHEDGLVSADRAVERIGIRAAPLPTAEPAEELAAVLVGLGSAELRIGAPGAVEHLEAAV